MSNRKTYLRTDSGNAEMFAALHGERVRFDHKQDRWLIWSGKLAHWGVDTQSRVRVMTATARERLRAASNGPASPDRDLEVRWALESENRYRIDAALELAKSLPPISDDGESWDSNPWLFGVATDVIDLRAGFVRVYLRIA